MAINSIYGSSSRLRVSGMSSGMDTDALVRVMTDSEYNRVTRAYQNKVRMQYKKEAYGNVSDALSSFNGTFLSSLGSSSMRLSSAFKSLTVNVAQSASSANVKITAGNSAMPNKSHTVKVDALAKGVTLGSTLTVGTGGDLTGSTKMSDIIDFGEADSITMSLTNNSGDPVVITVNKTDTVSAFAKKISSSKLDITLNVSEISGAMYIESKKAGASAAMALGESSSLNDAAGTSVNVFAALGFNLGGTYTAGQNGSVVIDGYTHTIESNKLTLDGLTFEFMGTTDEIVGFSVAGDIETPINNIKSFVDAFNKLFSDLYSKTHFEQKQSKYFPLTDEMKDEMKDSEIEQWEAMSKLGVLYNDSKITSLLDTMRKAFTTPVEGMGLNFADIGIDIGPYEKGKAPKIVVNEAKLRKALEENPNEVEKLFTATVTTDDKAQKFKGSGLVLRLSQSIADYETLISKVKYTSHDFDVAILKLDQILSEATKRLQTKQEAAYVKLSAMEKALSNMQAQTSWLTNNAGTS